MSTILEQEIRSLETKMGWDKEFHREYIQDLTVYGSIASGYFYSSAYAITRDEAAKRAEKANGMIAHYQKKIDDDTARLELLLKMAEVQEVA